MYTMKLIYRMYFTHKAFKPIIDMMPKDMFAHTPLPETCIEIENTLSNLPDILTKEQINSVSKEFVDGLVGQELDVYGKVTRAEFVGVRDTFKQAEEIIDEGDNHD